MTNSIWNTLANTPWWLYAAYFFMIRISFSSLKPQILALKSLIPFPILCALVSAITLFATPSFTSGRIAYWLTGVLTGMLLGSLQFRLMKIKAILHEPKIWIPGSPALLIALIVFGFLRTYYNWSLTIDMSLLAQPDHALKIAGILGLLTGLSVGRILYALHCLKQGPYLTPATP
ncbi:MAG: hypothetical protein A3E85_01595 [Gammaproteobacteria bacterium RIFCSPHIGHO2_12_FULL_45_12]|nr:MAG: hypothetical protein A3E85_01595 [Gammaproteobacteria bacterium RIFCSPHIGHO2_12_FULL_45_12]